MITTKLKQAFTPPPPQRPREPVVLMDMDGAKLLGWWPPYNEHPRFRVVPERGFEYLSLAQAEMLRDTLNLYLTEVPNT